MNILFSSAFIVLLVLLITQFTSSKHGKTLKVLAVFGIIVGTLSIFYVSFFDSRVSIISPIKIRSENATSQNLKVYAITFAEDQKDTINRKVIFDQEIEPTKLSEFSIDGQNIGKFWLVAKNDQNDIKFLKEVIKDASKVDIKITDEKIQNEEDAQTARELIFSLEINKQVLNFAIWSNIILIVLLIWSFTKINKNTEKLKVGNELEN